jgi:integrase
MSIERVTRSDGRTTYVVRWYDSGRGSTRRKRTFDRRRDAELFEASIRRAHQLGQLASEVIGSNATLEEFLVEWCDTYAVTHLRPNTLLTYTTLLDRWIVPYLGRKRLREITRQTIDAYCAQLRLDGAGVPTVNRALGVLQGVFHRAVEWRRLAWNPVVGTRRLSHTRAATIDARTPETVEAIRLRLDPQNAALVSILAYEGLRPGEAYALVSSPSTSPRAGRSRARSSSPTRQAAISAARTGAAASGSRRSSGPASPTSAAYDLRHTCATLLLYEGRTLNEVAEHLGHADPGFTARTYAHVMRDATRRRRVPIAQAIRTARAAARRRPVVDPSTPAPAVEQKRPSSKSLQIERADAGTRTPDPIITRTEQASPPDAPGRVRPHESRKPTPPRWRPKTPNGKRVDPT